MQNRQNPQSHNNTRSSSWGRIMLGRIISMIFGGIAILAGAMIVLGQTGDNLFLTIVALIVGIIGAIWGVVIRSGGRKIEVDPETGHAKKIKL